MNYSPLVSVIIPTFNRPDLLKNAVKSVLLQTMQDFELIVINDGGENVQGLLSSLFSEEKIKFINLDVNKGRSFARNAGLELSKGKYVAYLDDDDIYYSDHLEKLVFFLENNIDYKVAYSESNIKNQEKKKMGNTLPLKRNHIRLSSFIPESFMFIIIFLLFASYIIENVLKMELNSIRN